MRGKKALGQICGHHGEAGWEMCSDMAQVTKGSAVDIKYLQSYKRSKLKKGLIEQQNPVQNQKTNVWSWKSYHTFAKQSFVNFVGSTHCESLEATKILQNPKESSEVPKNLQEFP